GHVLAEDLDQRIALDAVVGPVEFAFGIDDNGVTHATFPARNDVVATRNVLAVVRRCFGTSRREFLHRLPAGEPCVRMIGVGGAFVFTMPTCRNIPTVGAQPAIDRRHHVADHIRIHRFSQYGYCSYPARPKPGPPMSSNPGPR